MTDIISREPTDVDPNVQVAEAPAEKAAPKNVSKPCKCSEFEVQGESEDETFTTGCEQETKREFAQGHDAKLISFLVDGYFDGYTLRWADGVGTVQSFAVPADAPGLSAALIEKARKATENRREKIDAAKARKAEREAAKTKKAEEAAAKKAEKEKAAEAKKAEAAEAKKAKPQAEVVAGSTEGDAAPAPEGQVKIKVGRWEYNATVNEESGEATFVDGKGETQTIERDGYRVLS